MQPGASRRARRIPLHGPEEEVYLNAYESMADARQSLKKYFEFYNQNRKHQTLKATPDQVY